MASLDEQYGDGWADAVAADYAERVEARQLEDDYERYEGPMSWSQFVAARQAADREAMAGTVTAEDVLTVEPDEDGNWF